MPVAGPTDTHQDVRRFEAGMLLIGAGALLLFISLFLEWYQPGVDAWEIFEVWDLVLAVLAIAALVAVASRMGFGPPRPASWLVVPAVAAFVIVLYLLINPPPLVPDIDGDPSTGLWLALAASALMIAGAVLSVARISVAFTNDGPPLGAGHGHPGHHPAHPAEPVHPAGQGGLGGRFGRGSAAPPAAGPADPAGPGTGPGRGPGPGPASGPGAVPPTEPTRRL